jgi:hypothetical protein
MEKAGLAPAFWFARSHLFAVIRTSTRPDTMSIWSLARLSYRFGDLVVANTDRDLNFSI